MPCLVEHISPEVYFAALAFVVGALMRAIKRTPIAHPDALPVFAFVVGWLLDAAHANLACGYSYTAAGLSGLGGGIAGLAAAGGHEALKRTMTKLGLGTLADKLLGTAKRERDKRASKGSSALIVLVAVLGLSGCSTLLAALSKAQQGAQYLDTVVEVASAGADAYFARHPSLENESKVDAAVRRTQGALAALNAALATAEAASDEDVAQARTEALRAYAALRDLLADLGVLSATPPAGGAETGAPEPEPFALPEPERVEVMLGGEVSP